MAQINSFINKAGIAAQPQARKAFIADLSSGAQKMKVIPGALAQRITPTGPSTTTQVVSDKALRFFLFSHPFAKDYLAILEQGGIDDLLSFNWNMAGGQVDTGDGNFFKTTYEPETQYGLVRTPYPRNNVSFGEYINGTKELGPNFIYNIELNLYILLDIIAALKNNGKYDEALDWFSKIVDPFAVNAEGKTEPVWKVAFFQNNPQQTVVDFLNSLSSNSASQAEDITINEWKDNPFRPHLIAKKFPAEYMRYILNELVETYILLGDRNFIMDTMEGVNMARFYYTTAQDILGAAPRFIPVTGKVKIESYSSLRDSLDDFSNAKVLLENIFPFSGEVTASTAPYVGSLTGTRPDSYFSYPPNTKVLELFDLVNDRLDKIRHCRNISGVERQLALWEPSIDPELLIQATKQGIDIGSVLADVNAPAPFHHFSFLIQKAIEFCNEVRSLGNSLLSAIEKRDAEQLSILRADHDWSMLDLLSGIKERQVLEAKSAREGLVKSRENAAKRLQHYLDLLGVTDFNFSDIPQIAADIKSDSTLPPDGGMKELTPDVDVTLVDFDQSGLKLIPKEKEEMDKNSEAQDRQKAAGIMESIAGYLHLIPDFYGDVKPIGIGTGLAFGGRMLGTALSASARAIQTDAGIKTYEALKAGRLATYIRREQEWAFSANIVIGEMNQLDKQITSSDIRIQVTQRELDNHYKQVENASEIKSFLTGDEVPGYIKKQSTIDLYQWMRDQYALIYKDFYFEALKMARKAQKAYEYETGKKSQGFIGNGYWDSFNQGFTAGDKLMLSLRQMESSFMEESPVEKEMLLNVSLATYFPLELIRIKQGGIAEIEISEELIHMRVQSVYDCRIKSVSISSHCLTGPSASINFGVRLLKNSIRLSSSMLNGYERMTDSSDDRFAEQLVPFNAIITSTAQNDHGHSDTRQEVLHAFEGAGVISRWQFKLFGKCNVGGKDFDITQFDVNTISDISLNIVCTVREDNGDFEQKVVEHLYNYVNNVIETTGNSFQKGFSLKYDFPTEWYRFMNPETSAASQVMEFFIDNGSLPFIFKKRDISVTDVKLFVVSESYTDWVGLPVDMNFLGTEKTTDNKLLKDYVINGVSGTGITVNKELNALTPWRISIQKKTEPGSTIKNENGFISKNAIIDIYLVCGYSVGQL